MSKYLLFIIAALLVWPIVPAIYYLPQVLNEKLVLYDTKEIEKMWRMEAVELEGATVQQISKRLKEIQKRYPEADLFWVDETGKTRFIKDRLKEIPNQWTFTEAVTFIEKQNHKDTYISTFMIGNNPNQGFMVFYIPKSFTELSMLPLYKDHSLVIVLLVACGSLVLISFLFFFNMLKRLIKLQVAMGDTGVTGIPDRVVIRNRDEIGMLERAFNQMVSQLTLSRNRELEEERLRKQLIANISHDLRTPLTIIRQHAYSVQNNPSSPTGAKSMDVIVNKLEDVGKLMDNLLSYTLLTAGKYPIDIKNTDVIEEFRDAVAEWYPVFEKEGFELDIDLPETSLFWGIDPLWFRCILDNLFQNVIRHTKSGRYIGIKTIDQDGVKFLVITDKGLGMEHQSEEKGAGIGLAIISLMTKEMDITWNISSTPNGTSHHLGKMEI
ncbi:HAMP domain-containing histidine kinase [Rossellomorea sp. BNER]|nr:HAMP domain-containing histidine kinase [Rossellomorea sp. BNER]